MENVGQVSLRGLWRWFCGAAVGTLGTCSPLMGWGLVWYILSWQTSLVWIGGFWPFVSTDCSQN